MLFRQVGQQVAEDPVLVGRGDHGLEGDVHLCLLHEVQQGVEVFLLEVRQNQCGRVSARFQHEGAGGFHLHLAQQLGDGLARVGRGDGQQLHAEGGSHPLEDAPVSGGQVPAQRQRNAGVLVACDMCFHSVNLFLSE